MCIRVRKIDYKALICKAKVPKTCSVGFACWLFAVNMIVYLSMWVHLKVAHQLVLYVFGEELKL